MVKKLIFGLFVLTNLCFGKTIALTDTNYKDFYVKYLGHMCEIEFTTSGSWVVIDKGRYIRSDYHKKFEDLIYELYTKNVTLVRKSNINKFTVEGE